MDVILLEKLENYGKLGDTVSVKSGFARNFLIPKGKAVFATPANIEEFEKRRADLEKQEQKKLASAKALAEKLNALEIISIAMRAAEDGKLFGSVGTRELANTISDAVGFAVENSQVRLDEGRIREIGEYQINIHLHSDVDCSVNISIVAED